MQGDDIFSPEEQMCFYCQIMEVTHHVIHVTFRSLHYDLYCCLHYLVYLHIFTKNHLRHCLDIDKLSPSL